MFHPPTYGGAGCRVWRARNRRRAAGARLDDCGRGSGRRQEAGAHATLRGGHGHPIRRERAAGCACSSGPSMRGHPCDPSQAALGKRWSATHPFNVRSTVTMNAMLYMTGMPVAWQAPVVFSRIKSWGPVQKIYEVSPR